jgi:signal transduction histidine kinase
MKKEKKILATRDFEKSNKVRGSNIQTSKIVLIGIIAFVCSLYILRQFITYQEFSPFYIILFLIIPGIALGMSVLVLKSQIGTPLARTFLFLSLALSFLFIAEQMWTAFEYFLLIDPFPSMADIFYILSYPFFALFLFSYLKPLKKYITKRIVGFAVILSSSFILPVFMTTYDLNLESDMFEFIMALLYPVADAILLVPAIIGILFLFRGEQNYFWGAMLVGILLTVIADVTFTFLDAGDAYEGGNLIELGWLTAYILWAFACYEYKKKSSIANTTKDSHFDDPVDFTTIQKLVIPLTFAVILLVIVISIFSLGNPINEKNESQIFQHMTYIVFGIIGVFLIMMIIMYKNLERLVSLKTKELQEKQQLIQEQYIKLQQVEREKGEFLAMIAHDLKTPLVPIKGYAELLLTEKLGKLEEGQKQRIRIIDKSTDTLVKLIDDLLDNQKIEVGQLKLNKEKLNLGNVIIETLEKFKQTISDKSIILFQNVKSDINIHGDRIRIEQVLQNVILNAIDFMPENNGNLDVVLTSDDDYATVSIIDNGLGIEQEKIKNLFDKFYQINTGYIRKYGGSGLGLAICKAIIDKHDGSLGAQSEGIGKGTTFFFKLPLLKEAVSNN